MSSYLTSWQNFCPFSFLKYTKTSVIVESPPCTCSYFIKVISAAPYIYPQLGKDLPSPHYYSELCIQLNPTMMLKAKFHRQVVDVMQRDSIKTSKLASQRHITIIDVLTFS